MLRNFSVTFAICRKTAIFTMRNCVALTQHYAYHTVGFEEEIKANPPLIRPGWLLADKQSVSYLSLTGRTVKPS